MKIRFLVMLLAVGSIATPLAAADLPRGIVPVAKPGRDEPVAAAPSRTVPHEAPEVSTGPAGAVGQANAEVGTRTDGGAPWAAYREFKFDFDSARIMAADRGKIKEIAAFMAKNPQAQIGLDGSVDPHGPLLHDQVLTDRRIKAVRDALIDAGVPESNIHVGAFAHPDALRDRQVEVVVRAGH